MSVNAESNVQSTRSAEHIYWREKNGKKIAEWRISLSLSLYKLIRAFHEMTWFARMHIRIQSTSYCPQCGTGRYSICGQYALYMKIVSGPRKFIHFLRKYVSCTVRCRSTLVNILATLWLFSQIVCLIRDESGKNAWQSVCITTSRNDEKYDKRCNDSYEWPQADNKLMMRAASI